MVTSDNKLILTSGRFSKTTRVELAQAFQKFAADPKKDRLVLHFHGGLVPEQYGEKIASRLLSLYRDKGNAYPVFTIWQSGLLEIVRNHWRELGQDNSFRALIERVVQYLLGQLDSEPGERGGSIQTPPIREVQAEIATHTEREPLVDREPELASLPDHLSPEEAAQFAGILGSDVRVVQGGMRLVQQDATQVSDELRKEIAKARATQEPETRGLLETGLLVRAGVRIIGRCLARYAKGSHHGFYTTVVEETGREIKGDLIASIIWKRMKQDTEDAFGGSADTHGGSALLEEIAKLAAATRPRIVLVGHSTGAVYICHLLQAVQARRLRPDLVFEVLFLAPACTFDLMLKTLKTAGGRIAKFRSFGMEDGLEIGDQLAPPIYMRSLLYFVSGIAEDDVDMPLVGMQRYHTGEFTSRKNIQRVLSLIATHPNAWVWSKTNTGLGLSSLSASHGDFDDDTDTLASVAHLVSTGAYT